LPYVQRDQVDEVGADCERGNPPAGLTWVSPWILTGS